jgi:hypothetical protein
MGMVLAVDIAPAFSGTREDRVRERLALAIAATLTIGEPPLALTFPAKQPHLYETKF